MRTPDGRECPFFYGDYYRGRNFEECQALMPGSASQNWRSSLCKTCTVPRIKQHNACPNLVISVVPEKQLFVQKMKMFAQCTKSGGRVKDPDVGCGLCHEN